MGRCMLTDAKLDKELWPYAVMAAVYIRNRCLNNRLAMTPFEALTGIKPNVKNMKTFGSKCFVLNQQRKKLDNRGLPGIFVGYDKGSPAYLIYFAETGKIMRHRVVQFIDDIDRDHNKTDDDEFFLS